MPVSRLLQELSYPCSGVLLMVFNTFSDGAFGTGAVAALETDVATWNQKRRCLGPDLDCKKLVGGSLKTSYLSNLRYILIVL